MQSFPTILQKEMSQTEALLKEALSQFDRLSYDNGKAKACYLLAELYIEKQLGKSVELRYEQKFLFDILEVCVSLYNQLGIKHMEAKSLLLLSRHYFDC